MNKTTLIEFPCLFPVKIIGLNNDFFIDEIKEIVLKHAPNFQDCDFSHKLSEKNNYLAITVRILALNQEMLDEFYQDVTKHPHVKMVL